ncbi:hypothetical protein A4X13_0g9312 [Tilletia indica]|uniref:Uncharacterized protein n=1 Tax=Tilletia indica TaxID=43049 RepID=A0A177T3T0_9BASI|nr:hypothetical protein A4X13_0g9312 [Tilletia indica]
MSDTIDPSLLWPRTDNNNTPYPHHDLFSGESSFIEPYDPSTSIDPQAFGLAVSQLASYIAPHSPTILSSGHSDSFTTPSYQEPSISFDSAIYFVFNRFSHMDEVSQDGWFAYVEPWIRRHVTRLINQATLPLTQEVDRLTAACEALDRALRGQVRLSANTFHFPAASAWSQRAYDIHEFRTMNHRTGRKLAAELILIAEGDIHHPTILANPIYSRCLQHFGPVSDH